MSHSRDGAVVLVLSNHHGRTGGVEPKEREDIASRACARSSRTAPHVYQTLPELRLYVPRAESDGEGELDHHSRKRRTPRPNTRKGTSLGPGPAMGRACPWAYQEGAFLWNSDRARIHTKGSQREGTQARRRARWRVWNRARVALRWDRGARCVFHI